MMTLRFCLRLAGASLMSLGFLYWAFADIDHHALWAAIKHVHPSGVIVYLLALAITQVTRAVRWGILVRPFAPMTNREIWQVSNLGNMLIMLLPLRLGELARPYMMRSLCGASMSAGMGAAVIERVLDGLLVTLLFFGATWLQRDTAVISAPLQTGAEVALLIFVAAVVLLVLTVRARGLVQACVAQTIGRVSPGLQGRVTAMLQAFIVGLKALPDIRTTFGVIGWTLAYWAANALGLWALMQAFGCSLPPIAGFTVVCVLVIGVMIPAGPGLLGTYQAALIAGLGIYHIDKNVAAALSVVAYLGNLGVIVCFGLPYVAGAGGFRLKSFTDAAQAAQTP